MLPLHDMVTRWEKAQTTLPRNPAAAPPERLQRLPVKPSSGVPTPGRSSESPGEVFTNTGPQAPPPNEG